MDSYLFRHPPTTWGVAVDKEAKVPEFKAALCAMLQPPLGSGEELVILHTPYATAAGPGSGGVPQSHPTTLRTNDAITDDLALRSKILAYRYGGRGGGGGARRPGVCGAGQAPDGGLGFWMPSCGAVKFCVPVRWGTDAGQG